MEYELDPQTMRRTGRRRRYQFHRTMRRDAVLPSKRTAMEFYG